MIFADRRDAGRRLARSLKRFAGQDPVVLAMPRGGVPVAMEVATALHAPLDLVIVRKVGLPSQPELAMGAVVDGAQPTTVRNADVIEMAGVSEEEFAAVRDREVEEARRRRQLYLGDRKHVEIRGRTVILIDDGIATGASMRAALLAVRRRHPRSLVMAVPVAATTVLDALRVEVDEVVCLEASEALGSVGQYYEDFAQVSDGEVIAALAASRLEDGPPADQPS